MAEVIRQNSTEVQTGHWSCRNKVAGDLIGKTESGDLAKRSDIRQPLIVAALIVVVTVVVAVGGVVLKTRDQINRDKVEFVADSNSKQVAQVEARDPAALSSG